MNGYKDRLIDGCIIHVGKRHFNFIHNFYPYSSRSIEQKKYFNSLGWTPSYPRLFMESNLLMSNFLIAIYPKYASSLLQKPLVLLSYLASTLCMPFSFYNVLELLKFHPPAPSP